VAAGLGAASLSGAVARRVRKWVRHFSESELEYFALAMPVEPWRRLADLVHLSPAKDFPPTCAWFLPFCFGAPLPADSKIAMCRAMTCANVNELLAQFPDLPYSYLKTFKTGLSDQSKELIARHAPDLDTILWFYEDLSCPQVDAALRDRLLSSSQSVQLPYGKLMERLLLLGDKHRPQLLALLTPCAEQRLAQFKSGLPAPVAVLGDASSSMSVAIRTATIISSLLTAICDASLSFFNTAVWQPAAPPQKVADVLALARATRASGATAPAAGLVPYFNAKKEVRTFVIVTDEEENTKAKTEDKRSWNFFELFMEYRRTVYPATLVFVSFLRDQHQVGQMHRRFLEAGVADVMQFSFCGQRPDLSRLDSILGRLCSRAMRSFEASVEEEEGRLKEALLDRSGEGLAAVGKEMAVAGEEMASAGEEMASAGEGLAAAGEEMAAVENRRLFETAVTTETVKINMF